MQQADELCRKNGKCLPKMLIFNEHFCLTDEVMQQFDWMKTQPAISEDFQAQEREDGEKSISN